jgi:hypothetical protein
VISLVREEPPVDDDVGNPAALLLGQRAPHAEEPRSNLFSDLQRIVDLDA